MIDRAKVLDWLSRDYRAPELYRRQAQQPCYGQALDAVDGVIADVMQHGRCLTMLSNPGAGKTFALWYAMNAASLWLRQCDEETYETVRLRGCIGSVHDYRRVAESRINDRSMFGEYCQWGGLTAYDEIGAEATGNKSNWQQETFELLIDYRYQNRLPTLLVSNLKVADFKARYGERVTDRLREWSAIADIADGSFRGVAEGGAE